MDDGSCTPQSHLLFAGYAVDKSPASFYIFVTGVGDATGFFVVDVDKVAIYSSDANNGVKCALP